MFIPTFLCHHVGHGSRLCSDARPEGLRSICQGVCHLHHLHIQLAGHPVQYEILRPLDGNYDEPQINYYSEVLTPRYLFLHADQDYEFNHAGLQ